MAAPRIPPVQGLLAFETLARLRSVTLAGEELAVTPSAVSHRIRQLESQLGINVTAEEADIELRFGTGPWPERESVRLQSDTVCPVCSPDYLHDAGPFDGFDTEARCGARG